MALPQGINFRGTAGFVSDTGNNDKILADAYGSHTSAQGNACGWEDSVFSADRINSIDQRLAGINYLGNGGTARFRIDLPTSGAKNIRLSAGDASNPQSCKVELFDSTTSLGVLCNATTTLADHFLDATNTEYTFITWPGSNTAISATFATTICRFKIGGFSGGSGYTTITHCYIEDGAAAAAYVPYNPWQQAAPILAQ